MPLGAPDAADAADAPRTPNVVNREVRRQVKQTSGATTPQVHGGHAGAAQPGQPKQDQPKPGKTKQPDQSAGPPQMQPQPEAKPPGNPIFDALGLPFSGLSPESLYDLGRSAASTWSHLINPNQREPFLATTNTDRMHSRMLSKITDTLAAPHGGHAGAAAPTGNQMVPPAGPEQGQPPMPGPSRMSMAPPRPLTPEQQREVAMHAGLMDLLHGALDLPVEVLGAASTIANLPGIGIGKAAEWASNLGPVQQAVVGDQPSDNDLRKLAPDADASGNTGNLSLLFPKESAQLKAMGYSDEQIQSAIMEALRRSPDIKKTVTQSDIGINLEGASLLGLHAHAGLTALDALKATKAIAGDAVMAQASYLAEFANPRRVAYAAHDEVPPSEAVPTPTSDGVARAAWAHIGATVAAGRKLPGIDRVVNRVLPGADAVDRHLVNELNVVSGARRERSPQLTVDPKKSPIESAMDIPPAENIGLRSRGGKEGETFQPLQHLSSGEVIDRASKMSEATQKTFFKKMGVADLQQFKSLVEGKRLSSAQVSWLAKSWKQYFPYDLRRVDVAEPDLRDPRQHLDTLPDEHKVNGQEFLAATHGLLAEIQTGPFGSSGAMAGSMMRSLLAVQRGTSATFQRWQETMSTFLKDHPNLGESERKAIEGDQAAYDALSPQQKLVVDSHRMLEATIRKQERQWGARKDHVPNFFPRRFVRPVGGKASTAGARPGAGPFTGSVKAHREEVFQTETPEQASERLSQLAFERDAVREELDATNEQLAEFDAQETRKGGPGFEIAKRARRLTRDLKRTERQLRYTDPQFILQQRFQTVEEANKAIAAQRDAHYEELTKPPEESGAEPMDEVKARQRADEAYPPLETNYYKAAPQDLVRRIHALHAHQAVDQLVNTVIEDKGQQLQAAYRGTPNRETQDVLAAHGFRSLNWGAMRDVQWHPVMADMLDRAHALQSMPKGKGQRAMRALERQMIGKIMYSPMLHGMNVAGRVGWFMVANPVATAEQVLKMIGASRKGVFDRRVWTENRRRDAYNAGMLPHTSSGKYGSEFYEGMALGTSDAEAANAPGFNDLTDAPLRVQGSPLAGVLGLGRAVGKGYEGINNMFWSRVNDFGTQLAYPIELERARKAGLDESSARLYAADRANAWVGQVRPERWMPFAHELSRLVFFAPNWWRSYGELVTGHYDKTGVVKNAALRQHVVKNEIRTLMAMWLWQHVSGNALNMLLSGHPQWENQSGNQDRLEMDHFFPVDPQTGAHMTLEPFLSRQTYALGKAAGLESGHPGWNVEDVPGGANAVLWGRISPLLSALGYAGNIDLYQSFTKGTFTRVDPGSGVGHPTAAGLLAALSQLVPLAPGLDTTRSIETLATKGAGPDEALGLPGTGNTMVPKNIKDLAGKGMEKLLLGLIGINPPYPYAERSRGQSLSQDELIKVKQQGDQYYGRLQELTRQMMDGTTTPQEALKTYHDLTTAYHGYLTAEFQNAPYYTHGALGLYHDWEDTYRQATGKDGQIDWAKLDDLQAKFEHDHSSAEMSAINSFSSKTQVRAPFLRIYHDTINQYRDFQQQQAGQLGISLADLRRYTSEYGALFNDRLASAQFLRQHPEVREYEQAKREWEVSTNAGLMYGLFYNTGTVVRWLYRHGLNWQELLSQVAGQGQVNAGAPSNG